MHNIIGDVLPSASRDVVDHRWPFSQHSIEVSDQAIHGSLAIIGVDVKGSMHADGKALLSGMQCFPGGIAACDGRSIQSQSDESIPLLLHCRFCNVQGRKKGRSTDGSVQ